jgi:hypothetical protein
MSDPSSAEYVAAAARAIGLFIQPTDARNDNTTTTTMTAML